MRSSEKTALCVLLITGFAFTAKASAPRQVSFNAGEKLQTSILTLNDNVVGCYLSTPSGDEIEFKPQNHSNDKYQLLDDTDFVKCQVAIRNLDSNDNGLWVLRSVSDAGTTRTESYQLTVISTVTEGTTDIASDNITTTEESSKEILTTITTGELETTIAQTTEVILDTTTPKDEVTAVDIEHVYIRTKLGETHSLIIPEYDFLNNEKCHLVKPDGGQYDFEDMHISDVEIINDYTIACGIRIFVSTEEMLGRWTLISRGTRFSTEVVERRLPFTIFLEETTTDMPIIDTTKSVEETSKDSTTQKEIIETTIADLPKETTEKTYTTERILETTTKKIEDVSIINIDPGYFVTKIGETHKVKIPEYDFLNSNECYIITQNGERHDIEHMQLYGIEAINDYNVACGVKVHIVSEDMVGDWMLVSRATRFSTEIVERRLPFTIVIEEIVNALPSEITIMEGKDIYIRLEDATSFHATCKLVDDRDEERYNVERDPRYIDTCGFIVRNATTNDSGFWKISYGVKTIYKAWTRVTVYGHSDPSLQTHFTWTLDRPVNQLMGPESTVYCRLVDASHNTVFDGFGRCNVTLSRASNEHAGNWKMYVGLQGRVLTDEYDVHVSIRQADPKPAVSTSVVSNKPTVTLTCSVASSETLRSCKFRDPAGRILLATPGVGEGRYTFHGNSASSVTGDRRLECGIQITDPVISDLGLWRCAMETDSDNYYGFLAALCPWAMRDPEVAASVRSEPVLEAESETVSGLAGETVTMSCSVQSPIRYCYFRARNGTTFSISPGESLGAVEYAGAGFDAGECSIRFSNLLPTDSGRWSCHVGFLDHQEPEQSAQFALTIRDTLVAEQRMEKGALIVTGRVYDDRALDYCRFVRIDGLGFTTDNLPTGYRSDSLLTVGRCEIRIPNPSVLERHPWTVAARVQGMSFEFSRQTNHSLQMPEAGGDDDNTIVIYRFPFSWIFIIVIGLSLIIIGILVGPKRNRKWTYAKASTFRESFRRSFTRKAASEQTVPEKNTPMSA
ncbi:PREDICTED: uncharacterized protein LOC106116755 isoform X1 [Papilio xuthus]|uniref:Uncharacterized protein LOC106116755 isoform X1 n=1 Tax=Papilio xuthus TaxID=66420 RepID=A0AAJ7E7P0_PAPXU|nr:PREDICTED: uncharacterized protein LOC106116755 isoform X1 [Papilio xuthus]